VGRPLQAARPAGELLCRRGRTPDDGRDLVEGTANMSSIGYIPSSLATEPESGGARYSEVAGPREESLVEMATLLASRRGHPSKIEGVSDPADPDHELNENGGLLPGPGAILAGPTFEEWLDSTS
jgi:hypothetical protein